jgi:hypothetical protein
VEREKGKGRDARNKLAKGQETSGRWMESVSGKQGKGCKGKGKTKGQGVGGKLRSKGKGRDPRNKGQLRDKW